MNPRMGVDGVYDVVVVGGGIMGSCAAYAIAKRGRSVLLLEQFDFLHRRGSSHGESRTMRVTYSEPYYTVMAKRSLQLWNEAEVESGYKVYTQTGQVDIGPASDPDLQGVIQSCQMHAVRHEVSSESTASFSLPQGWIAVRTDDAGVLKATKAVAMFQALALKHGAVLRDNTAVTKIATGWSVPGCTDGTLVATNRGSAVAKQAVVIAAGAWTNKVVTQALAQGAGLKLPITPLHTFISYWRVEPEHAQSFLASRGFPTFASYGERLIYGTPSLEYPGLIKVALHAGLPCDPDNRNHALSFQPAQAMVSSWISSVFGGKVQAEAPVAVEGCVYSMTPDEDFIIDFVPGTHSKVLLAAGFSGHGFKMAPLVGEVMAQLALTKGTSEEVQLDHFSLQRFTTQALGKKLVDLAL